ncbi:for [Symbiodinium natans]|uniref:For protein n=1 Tax=Symbiodinium natans TaxID=878477 RepID=A0A812III9_9DINO|nr:for [Symbiodinium natans]
MARHILLHLRLRPVLSVAPKRLKPTGLVQAHRRLVQSLSAQLGKPKAASKASVEALLPLDLFQRVVAALDARSWGFSGATLPSPLGQFCESSCRPGAPLRDAAATALAPVLQALQQHEERLGESAEEEEPEASTGPRLVVSLPDPETARQSSVVLLPQFFGEEEIELVKRLSADLRGAAPKAVTAGQWRTCYLQQDGFARKSLATILDKLADAAVQRGPAPWRPCKRDAGLLRPRCVEHHLVSPGGALPDPTHFDGGSLFTIDVMLCTPGVDFQGGDFCTLEGNGLQKHAFDRGDALIFLSHKAHCVQPVTEGLRQTLVMELWEGEERRCNHRCHQRSGRCEDDSGGDAGEETWKADRVAQEGSRLFATTAFEGIAFFPKVAQLLRQGARPGQRANVEVVFEDPSPVAFVRAKRSLRRGEILAAQLDADDDQEEVEEVDTASMSDS